MNKSRSASLKSRFASLLLKWNREQNDRQMPWKGVKDPYKIWLSEIILQQTRVEQGLEYYNRFVQTFPDVHKLAQAPESKVFKLWEGLGYYSRCRNLIATAGYVSKELKGKFPDNYEAIRSLKGIGPYTAAAISSFAFNLPYAVVDGNVFRVLSRVFGINKPIDSVAGKKYFTALADELLDRKQPGIYNQAIMDFGAVVCKPAAPLCDNCIFKNHCRAFKNHKVSKLPVKTKKIAVKKRWFYYPVLEYKNTVAVRLRTAKDIWQGLCEFPLIEVEKETDVKNILKQATRKGWLNKSDEIVSVSAIHKQQLSHQLIAGQFIRIRLRKKPAAGFFWVEKNKLNKYAFPQLINQFINSERGK